ncbi:hypothetical protein [Pseudomonas aeruginosa]|uniref:hypothetical protein n=1 Tax=Pseudomonas aeruginosa TaxID=287 RepID=UPI00053E3469|nr:hypothetical protein [Pseudomonas aeruginosa]
MRYNIEMQDDSGKAWFTGKGTLPGDYMLKLVADRMPTVIEKGLEFAQGAVPFFGGELAKICKKKGTQKELDKAAIELILAVLAVESMLALPKKT